MNIKVPYIIKLNAKKRNYFEGVLKTQLDQLLMTKK